MNGPRDFDAERRRIIRRITLLTWGLWALVAFLAIGGGALLAWIFRGVAGLSFTALWVIAAAALVAVPAAVHVGMRMWGRRGNGREDGQ